MTYSLNQVADHATACGNFDLAERAYYYVAQKDFALASAGQSDESTPNHRLPDAVGLTGPEPGAALSEVTSLANSSSPGGADLPTVGPAVFLEEAA